MNIINESGSIRVDRETLKALVDLKYDLRVRTMNDVIKYLINNNKK